MHMEDYIRKLRERKAIAAGTEKDVATQHKKGRLTARERINMLFDPDSFNEIDTLVTPRYDSYMGGKQSRYGDGVVSGFGLINGRRVFAAAQDASVMGGSLGEMHANKIVKAMRMALTYGCPFIALNDSGGARIQEGVDSLAAMRGSSTPTVSPPVSFRRSRSSSAPVPAAQSTRRA
jgi:acetyl-CoA carboxylase carboxyltransferase component